MFKCIGVCCLALVMLTGFSSGLFIRKHESDSWTDENSKLIGKLNLTYSERHLDLRARFPSKFSASFREFDTDFEIEFERVDRGHVAASGRGKNDDVYVIDLKTGEPVVYELKEVEPYENYKQIGGHGFATLIRNKPFDPKNPFRMIATIFLDETSQQVLDVFPVMIEKGERRRKRGTMSEKEEENRVYDSAKNHHALFRKSIELVTSFGKPSSPHFKIFDYQPLNNSTEFHNEQIINLKKQEETIKERRKKRAVNGQPIQLSAKVLVVAELSVYQSMQTYLGTRDVEQTLAFMRFYYAHLMNGVNTRYVNSLANDPDLQIRTYVTNYLFLTNAADQSWAASSTTYNGKPVVYQTVTLNAFQSYMNSLKLTFTYDMAVGFLNKDIWSDDTTQTAAQRSAVAGYATIGSVCRNDAYSIVEDFGGLSSIIATAHEMGHNLGAQHDGIAGTSADCPTTDNHILTPVLGFVNPLNLLTFSSCSIRQFKAALLNSALTATLSTRACLNTAPASLPVEVSSYVNLALPGQIFSANDQCQQIYGSSSSFCQFQSSYVCTGLSCRTSATTSSCEIRPGGVMEGTTCDSGKICLNGTCTTSSLVPQDSCPFGDDVVTQDVMAPFSLTLPAFQITCQQVFALITSKNQAISGYCSNTYFNSLCCQSCKKYNALACRDLYSSCPSITPSQCGFYTFNGQLATAVCPRTCGTCPGGTKPQTCTNSTYVCQNGGTCVNTGATSGLFGYTCSCPSGYTGDLCETKTPCSPNPCQNGGTCLVVGSFGFQCTCTSTCSGFRCETCSGVTTTTILTTTRTSTTVTTTTTAATSTITGACASSPCQNGGTCLPAGASFLCNCPASCSGSTCSTCSETTITTMTTTTITTSSTIKTSPIILCIDYNTTYCSYYASRGYCSNNAYINGNPISISCALSCKTCTGLATTTAATIGLATATATTAVTTTTTTTRSPTCVDSQTNCLYWAQYCNLLPNRSLCARTCNLC